MVTGLIVIKYSNYAKTVTQPQLKNAYNMKI